MKRKLLLAALYVVGALGFHANAQKDVTNDYLKNAGFEVSPIFDGTSLGADKASNATPTTGSELINGAVNVYNIEGWSNITNETLDYARLFTMPYNTELYINSNGTVGNQKVTAPANNSSDMSVDNKSLLFVEANWCDKKTICIEQKVKLPKGVYKLTFDSYVSTTLSYADSRCGVKVGNEDGTYKWPTSLNTWTNNEIPFNVEEDDTEVTISMGYFKSSNQGGTSSAFLFVDNVRLWNYTQAAKEDYDALNEAIKDAEDKTKALGFGKDKYAPYNNVEALVSLAAAKNINQEIDNAKEYVNSVTEALKAAEWKANTEEVNAVFDGSFATAKVGPATAAEAPADAKGWVAEDGTLRMIFDATYEKGKPGSKISTATSGKGMFVYNGTYAYGKTDGYTMPLEANTIYELNFKYAGWDGAIGEGKTAVSVSVLNEANQGLAKRDFVEAPSIMDDLRNSGKILFVTGDAGNYTLRLLGYSGNFVFTDITLFKAVDPSVEVTVSAAGYATFSSELPLDLSGIEGGKAYIATSEAEKGAIKLVEQTGKVAAGTGLVIAAEVGDEESVTVTIPVAVEGADLSDSNYLIATDGKEVEEGNYVLATPNDASEASFYILGAATVVQAGKAYLSADAVPATDHPTKAIRIVFDDENATAIEAVATEAEADGVLYNVAGQQVGKDYKGIVIDKNGKKYLNK